MGCDSGHRILAPSAARGSDRKDLAEADRLRAIQALCPGRVCSHKGTGLGFRFSRDVQVVGPILLCRFLKAVPKRVHLPLHQAGTPYYVAPEAGKVGVDLACRVETRSCARRIGRGTMFFLTVRWSCSKLWKPGLV